MNFSSPVHSISTYFKHSTLSLAIALSLSCTANLSYADDNQARETQTLQTIVVKAQGNWLEQATA